MSKHPPHPGFRVRWLYSANSGTHMANFPKSCNFVEFKKCNALLTVCLMPNRLLFLGLSSQNTVWCSCRRGEYLQRQQPNEEHSSLGDITDLLHAQSSCPEISRVGWHVLKMPIYLGSNHRYFIKWQKKSLSRYTTSKSGTTYM